MRRALLISFVGTIGCNQPNGSDTDNNGDTDTNSSNCDLAEGGGGANGTYAGFVALGLPQVQSEWRADAQFILAYDDNLDLGSNGIVTNEALTLIFGAPGIMGYVEYGYYSSDESWHVGVETSDDSWGVPTPASELSLTEWCVDSPAAIAATGNTSPGRWGAWVGPAVTWRELEEGCLNPDNGYEDPGWDDDNPVWCVSWYNDDGSLAAHYVVDGRSGDVIHTLEN